jgi:ABC-type branched-subunit amino acid transport system substrate-binding protein
VLLAVALAATSAACGARLSDAEREQAIAATQGGGDGGTNTDGEPTSDTTLVGSTDGNTTGDPGPSATGGPATGGTTTGGPTGSTGDTCKPGSATSTGVTPTEIKVGNVSQLTGLVPGFGQTGVNGVKAYFNMINNQGGVCGRKLTLVQADDRFQAATNRSETEKLAGQVIALVGGTTVVDDGAAPVIDALGLPDVSLATTPVRAGAKNNFSPNPIDPTAGTGNGTEKILRHLKATYGVSSAAIFYQDAAVAANQRPKYEKDFAAAGIPVVATYAVAVTATNFRSQAADIKQRGIELVITIAELNTIANLAKAFQDVGYFPKVPFYGAQVYGKKYIQLAGAASENTISALAFATPEQTEKPGVQAFNTWYARTNPGADVDFFALVAWTAAEMFVKALRQAGPDPSQAKLLEQLRTFTTYSSDMVAQINPAGKKPAPCFNVMQVKGGKWTKVHPAQGFDCG